MNDRLNLFIKKLSGIEGGTCVDSGGLTSLGISQRAYPEEDIAHLTPERAAFLFERDYYNPLCIEEINCPYTAFQILAFGVNAGVSGCKRKLFDLYGGKALPNEKASDVINRIEAADRDGFFSKMLEAFVDHYFYLAESKPSIYGQYLKGWIHRLCRGIDL